MKEYSNYIFDFDYTLFDTSKGMNACYEKAFSSIGYKYKDNELDLYVKNHLKKHLKDIHKTRIFFRFLKSFF